MRDAPPDWNDPKPKPQASTAPVVIKTLRAELAAHIDEGLRLAELQNMSVEVLRQKREVIYNYAASCSLSTHEDVVFVLSEIDHRLVPPAPLPQLEKQGWHHQAMAD